MGKLAWDDSHKYSVELTAREMRIICACLGASKMLIDNGEVSPFTKTNYKKLENLCNIFTEYNDLYFLFGLYPDKIGKRAKRIKPPIDKP